MGTFNRGLNQLTRDRAGDEDHTTTFEVGQASTTENKGLYPEGKDIAGERRALGGTVAVSGH